METKKISISEIFIIFYIMSIFGTVIETVWGFYRHGTILIRTSMILECMIPLYGLGALILLFILKKVNTKNIFLIFLISFIVGGLFEVICAYFQEIVIGTYSWDYSSKFLPFFGGKTCFKYCVFWGIIGIVWIKYIFPFLHKIINKIKGRKIKKIALLLFVIFFVDASLSIIACQRWYERNYEENPSNVIEKKLDIIFTDDYMIDKYPKMKIIKE